MNKNIFLTIPALLRLRLRLPIADINGDGHSNNDCASDDGFDVHTTITTSMKHNNDDDHHRKDSRNRWEEVGRGSAPRHGPGDLAGTGMKERSGKSYPISIPSQLLREEVVEFALQ